MSKKLTALSLNDKIEIIEAVNRNVNKKELTATYNCDISTINRIIKNADELRSLAASNNNLKRKRLRKSSHETVEKALNLWFDEVRQQSGSITSSLLLEKAREFAAVVDKNFCPDLNWVWRWRQRQGIQIKKRKEETTENNTCPNSDYQKFLLPEILSNYTPENIFSANETALYYKALPNTTQAKATENSTGQKQPQSRMTFLLFCNATGSFRQMFAIGKPKNPNSLHNKHLPIKYFSNHNAWMTSNIWNDILKTLDDELVAKQRNILLLVNNVACHKNHVNLKNIKVEYLPMYTGAIFQPIELGISHAFKMHYRKITVRRQLFALEKGKTVKQFWQSITILNALQSAKAAWDAVTSRKISNCFKRAKFISGDEECESEEDIELLSYSSRFVHCDSMLRCYGSLEEAEILETVMKKVTTSDTEEEANLRAKEKPPSIKEALLSLEILEKFCQANAIDYGTHTNTLENKIFNLLVKKLGPTKIKQFFKIPLE